MEAWVWTVSGAGTSIPGTARRSTAGKMSALNSNGIREETVRHLQALIRCDTTNPPGNERAASMYLAELLEREGFAVQLLEAAADRTNLVTRLEGRGERDPLLLYGHLDVVEANVQEWTHPPFAAELADGYVWGRGALDMKGLVIMQVMALVLAKRQGIKPRGDIIFAGLADEEAGGELGALWLVNNYADLVRAECALSEVGGFTLHLGKRRFYPIMVGEKGVCGLKLVVRGMSGHASMPVRDAAVERTARVLRRLTSRPLPQHNTPMVTEFIRTLATHMPRLQGVLFRLLLNPRLSGLLLAHLARSQDAARRDQGRMFHALLHNTVSPTILRAGDKLNIVPGEVEIEVDGRLLPGQTPEKLVDEVRKVIDDEEVEIEVGGSVPIPQAPTDTDFYRLLTDTLRKMDPEAIPVPYIIPATSDARHFARLGIPTYGCFPLRLPPDLAFGRLFHGPDERIPVEGLLSGVQGVLDIISAY